MTTPIASLRQCMKITFPPVMLQLLEEAVKPTPDFTVIATILGFDPVLTATVLALANSPYYGAGQKVTDLNRAATILGTKEILKIALSITYQKHLHEAFEKRGIDFYANWRLIIWSAIAAELLAERLCRDQMDQAYLIALLKDISLLMLVCTDSCTFSCENHGPVLVAMQPGQTGKEHALWNTGHGDLTAQLLADWKIDIPRADCLKHHHEFERLDEFDPLTQCIILATRWSEMELNSPDNPKAVIHFRAMLQRRLSLSQEEAEELVERLASRFQSVLATLGIAEAAPVERFYQHSLRLMQEYHFLASELADVSDGKGDVARIIARHLRWEWGVDEWELTLSVPEYQDWDFFVSTSAEGVRQVPVNDGNDLPWTFASSSRFPIVTGGHALGELRLNRKKLKEEDIRQISLYMRFVSNSYEHYALRQTVLELKAHTLDQLPVGVARLSPKGTVLEVNARLKQFLGTTGDCRGMDLWHTLGEAKDFARDAEWGHFLNDSAMTSLHKIFCLWQGPSNPTDSCVYLAAEKRHWHGREEILLFLEDVSLIAGWEFKALKQGEFLERLVRSMRDAVLTIDAHGRISFASPRVSHLLEKNLFELAKPVASYQGEWGPSILTGAPASVEVALPLVEEFSKTLELVFSPLPKEADGHKHWLVVGRDITAVRRLEEKLKRLALFDGLTGLLNHYQFHVLLEREVQRAKRTDRSIGLMFFDLDNFKAINDTKGHQAGDDVLRTVARILKAGLRKGMDYPCRYGGDEYAIIITEIDTGNLRTLCKRINDAVEEHFQGEVGLSSGVAMLQPGESPAQLLQRADKASYAAKSQGGHRIIWSEEQ